MERILDEFIGKPVGKVYFQRAIFFGTFIGGPLVGGFMFYKNFKSLGDYSKLKPTWIITIFIFTLTLLFIYITPDDIQLPNYIFPIIYTSIALGSFKKYQESNIIIHKESGGEVYSWFMIIGVTLIGLIITLLLLIAPAFLFEVGY